jgi:hypothetical protein
MEGKKEDAKAQYEQAEKLSKKLKFEEGKVNARAGLARLRNFQKE